MINCSALLSTRATGRIDPPQGKRALLIQYCLMMNSLGAKVPQCMDELRHITFTEFTKGDHRLIGLRFQDIGLALMAAVKIEDFTDF